MGDDEAPQHSARGLSRSSQSGLGSEFGCGAGAGGNPPQFGGRDKTAVLRAVVEAMQLPADFDRAPLVELFLSREQLGSTGVGDGIAIPHPRHPVILPVNRPNVTICFLAQPLEFGSADKKPVDTLFVLISPTIRIHMQMLARISRALADSPVRQLLRSRGTDSEILSAIRRIEESFDEPAATNGARIPQAPREGFAPWTAPHAEREEYCSQYRVL